MEKNFVDLEQRYIAAVGAVCTARTRDEKADHLQEAVRLAKTIEWMRNAIPRN